MSVNNLLRKSPTALPKGVQAYPFLFLVFLPGVFIAESSTFGVYVSTLLLGAFCLLVWWKGSVFSEQQWTVRFGVSVIAIHAGALLINAYVPELLLPYYLVFGVLVFTFNLKNFARLEREFIPRRPD